MPLRLATSRERRVHLFIGDLHAGVRGALHLDLLQHQALEHLLAQHVLRRQLELLLAQSLAHRGDLGVQVAVEHDPVVDDRDHPIQQLPLGGQFAGLRMGPRACRGAGCRPAMSVPLRVEIVQNRRIAC